MLAGRHPPIVVAGTRKHPVLKVRHSFMHSTQEDIQYWCVPQSFAGIATSHNPGGFA